MNDVTQILNDIQRGNLAATDDLLPLVYAELRQLAQARMNREPDGHTLQPTALVHEAYVRLVATELPQQWDSQGHFFAAAATAMRRILIENARRKQSLKRGGARKRVDADSLEHADPNDPKFLTDLDEALQVLSESHPAVAQVVNLRFFAGLSIEESAQALGISVRSVNRHWAFAKAWLHQQLSDERHE